MASRAHLRFDHLFVRDKYGVIYEQKDIISGICYDCSRKKKDIWGKQRKHKEQNKDNCCNG